MYINTFYDNDKELNQFKENTSNLSNDKINFNNKNIIKKDEN